MDLEFNKSNININIYSREKNNILKGLVPHAKSFIE